MKKRCLSIVLCSLMLLTIVSGCTQDTQSSQESPSDQESESTQESQTVARSDQLTVYTALPEENAQTIFEAFEEETGITVKGVRLSAGEIYARVQAEANNPQVALWWGTSIETLNVAAEDGLLEPYSSPMIENVPEQFRDPNGIWTPAILQITIVMTNKDFLEENNLNPPTTWNDLLDPVYKGNIAIAHPATSGMSYSWLTACLTRFGEEEGFEYLKALDENILQYYKSSNSPPQMVSLNEIGATFCHTTPAMTNLKEGYNVEISYLDDGTSCENNAMALIKGGPEDEVENAKQFIDWFLSEETQELYCQNFYAVPANSQAEGPEDIKPLSEMNILDIDSEYFSENRERLITRFDEEICGQENLG